MQFPYTTKIMMNTRNWVLPIVLIGFGLISTKAFARFDSSESSASVLAKQSDSDQSDDKAALLKALEENGCLDGACALNLVRTEDSAVRAGLEKLKEAHDKVQNFQLLTDAQREAQEALREFGSVNAIRKDMRKQMQLIRENFIDQMVDSGQAYVLAQNGIPQTGHTQYPDDGVSQLSKAEQELARDAKVLLLLNSTQKPWRRGVDSFSAQKGLMEKTTHEIWAVAENFPSRVLERDYDQKEAMHGKIGIRGADFGHIFLPTGHTDEDTKNQARFDLAELKALEKPVAKPTAIEEKMAEDYERMLASAKKAAEEAAAAKKPQEVKKEEPIHGEIRLIPLQRFDPKLLEQLRRETWEMDMIQNQLRNRASFTIKESVSEEFISNPYAEMSLTNSVLKNRRTLTAQRLFKSAQKSLAETFDNILHPKTATTNQQQHQNGANFNDEEIGQILPSPAASKTRPSTDEYRDSNY